MKSFPASTPLVVAALCAAFFHDAGHAAESESAPKRPNVLLIVADDASFGDLGLSGSVTRTPNLDRLADRGILFTNFHVSPVCSVSRAMLLTGNNPVEVGLGAFDYTLYPPAKGKPGYEAYLTRNTVTIAELLQDAGYYTAMVGKWHLGGTRHGGEGPSQWGFDNSYGMYTGGANHWNDEVFHFDAENPEQLKELQAGKVPTEAYYEDGKRVERPIGIYSDDLFTNKMLDYLQTAKKEDKPFFAYVAYTTPHAPIQAPSELVDKYFDHYLKLGFEGLKKERFESQKKLGLISEDAVYPDPSGNKLVRKWDSLDDQEKRTLARVMATYSAMMESQDRHISKLLDYLQETGELDNTLIIYMADNGPEGLDVRGELSNPKLTAWVKKSFNLEFDNIGRGSSYWSIGTDFANATTGGLSWWKWFIGEGGIRVPLIIVPPEDTSFARRGQMTAEYAFVKDVPATILDYTGIKHPGNEFKGRDLVAPSGVSMRDYMEGNADRPRSEDQWVAFELFGNSYVQAGDYKAMRVRPAMYGDGKWHLYDIRKDPGETTPLDDAQPERLKKLIAIYENYAKEKGIVPVADNWSPWHGFIGTEKPKEPTNTSQ